MATTVETAKQQPQLQLTTDRIESLLSLTHMRCLKHNEYPAIITQEGKIVFYCGCIRNISRI